MLLEKKVDDLMKKFFVVLSIILSITLVGCTSEVALPDLTGLDVTEIETKLDDLGIAFEFIYISEVDDEKSLEFYSYHNHEIGDKINAEDGVIIKIYPDTNYFSVIEMEYDGPHLDTAFSSIDYLDPRGGYFEVTLKYCTDGDTGVFHYPDNVYNAIESNAKSVRFLNMDTEETYSGGEEEWGKPASVYTCNLLTTATSIIIQTDPGDSLLGTYGRLLGWVWIKLPNEEEFFLLNYMVVQQGLAQVKYEFGAGETISYGEYTYNEWMHIAEDYAYVNELGQWGDKIDYYWDYQENQPLYSRW